MTETAQWAHDAEVMRLFKSTPAYEVIQRHLQIARTYALSRVMGDTEYADILTWRGATAALDRALALPDRIITEHDRLKEA